MGAQFLFKELVEVVLSELVVYAQLVNDFNAQFISLILKNDSSPAGGIAFNKAVKFQKFVITANNIHRIKDSLKILMGEMLEVGSLAYFAIGFP